ncbi:hypothetical protein ACS0TY_023182 [Phlomoides rotata]
MNKPWTIYCRPPPRRVRSRKDGNKEEEEEEEEEEIKEGVGGTNYLRTEWSVAESIPREDIYLYFFGIEIWCGKFLR